MAMVSLPAVIELRDECASPGPRGPAARRAPGGGRGRGRAGLSEPGPCPLIGQPRYGWTALPRPGAEATVGLPLPAEPDAELVMVRCESCGVALEGGREIDLAAEWGAVCTAEEHAGRRIS